MNEPKPPTRVGRLLAEQAAAVLNFRKHDIPILAKAGLLKPIGNPPRHAVKYYFAAEIERLAADQNWLSRATRAIYKYWSEQNRKRRPGRAL
jgi:hypothetical protein